MELNDLTLQLGITSEDAAFLQQVLNETQINANEADGSDTAVEPVTISEDSIRQANEDSVLEKIAEQDNDTTSRFSSAIWYEKIQQQTIVLAGLGGIGSYVNFLLSRMHPSSIFIYDDDSVERVNLSGQLYGQNEIGQLKCNAARNLVRQFSDYGDVFAVSEKFTDQSQPGDIMICGFDNMEARKTFFKSWCQHVRSFTDVADRAKCLFIDGRLAAESFQVLCVRGDDPYAMEKYEDRWLFDDDEAEETICSYKQTSFCANMVASVMINCFVNFVANQCNPFIPRDVPFLTEYDASMMFFKTET